MPTTELHLYRIENFDPALHEREGFSCGATQIDNFLIFNAKKQQNAEMVRVRVLLPEAGSKVLGFHVLNAHSLDAGEAPAALAKKTPGHGRVPVAYVSMIGVDVSVQGRALGEMLLMDALRQIAQASKLIGTAAAVLDILNDGNTETSQKRAVFYRRFGFTPFPDDPNRMFLPMNVLQQFIAV
jgi:ribosomal protein S18 acetylase RimI-like enzyme